jgi:aspartate/tyrosine/aromatic aminotransferase
LKDNGAGVDFSHIEKQKGMFSFLGITTPQLERLRNEFGIYIVSSTRINLAGVNSNNIGYLTDALQSVLE